MEWQVGQWVTVRGSRPCRIVSVNGQNLCVENSRMGKWQVNANKPGVDPFKWEIGRRYKTTMDGITAMIIESGLRTVAGKLSTGYGLGWLNTTGIACGYDETSKNAPHLLPFLADEPSEPEPTLTERFTVERYGDKWRVRDHQTGKVAAWFLDEPLAEVAMEGMKGGDMEWIWSQPDEAVATDRSPKSRYHRTIKGVTIDLYDIAKAYGIKDHAQFHALKKIIMAGDRGYKDREQDLQEAIVSIQRARELSKGGA